MRLQHFDGNRSIGASVKKKTGNMKTWLVSFCLSFAVCANAQQQAEVQQYVIAAQKAAAQAAVYAKQAAAYNNQAAKEAATYAERAAYFANSASRAKRAIRVAPSLIRDATLAEQAAADCKQAAGQAEIDSAVSKLENERDETIAKLKAKYAPSISDLESQVLTLKGKAAELQSQRSLPLRQRSWGRGLG
jgi:hypothetical protein